MAAQIFVKAFVKKKKMVLINRNTAQQVRFRACTLTKKKNIK